MAKRTIILTEEQLDEVIGIGYGDDSIQDDFAMNGGNEVFTGEHLDDGEYSDPVTTDKLAKDFNVTDIGGLWNNGLGRGLTLREMSKAEWVKKNFVSESNKFFNGRTLEFSEDEKKFLMSCPNDSVSKNAAINGLPMEQLPPTISEFEAAIDKANKGDSSTLNNMGGKEAYELFKRKYEKLKKFSAQNVEAKKSQATKINRAKNSSNNGEIITYDN